MDFYTNVYQRGDKLYVRGYLGGKRYNEVIDYEPYLFEEHPTGQYRTIHDVRVQRVDFESISRAKKYSEQFSEVENKTVYGITQWAYLYIYDQYRAHRESIEFDPSVISVVTIDIEVAADDGFPSIRHADKEVTAITLRKNGQSVVLGCQVYREKSEDVVYVLCRDESELLENFIKAWKYFDPDVVTGWNVLLFDVPYMVNRINAVLGEGRAKDLSPWRILDERGVESHGAEQQSYLPAGVTILDYMVIYKKFSHKNQESYSLNNIASVELKEKKLDYAEYGSLLDLYKKNYELFIDYNLADVVLVDKLEEKLGYIQLVFSMTYNAGVNYIDTVATTRQWDMLIHAHLMDRNIVVPPMRENTRDAVLMGGYVKEPQLGMHEWVVSFDLNSLYMHLVMQYNISPDTFVSRIDNGAPIDDILSGELMTEEFKTRLRRLNYSMTANTCTFRRNKRGFLPEIVEKIYNNRVVFKKKMLEAKERVVSIKNELKLRKLV